MSEDRKVVCHTAGNIINDLTIDCGVHWCGQIVNGVAFGFADNGNWILDYADLKAAYELATAFREKHREQIEHWQQRDAAMASSNAAHDEGSKK